MSTRQIIAPEAQAAMHIHRMDTLQALIDLSAFNPSVGFGVKDLTIILAAGTGDVAQAIRRALRMTPNLEKLVLNIAAPVPNTLLAGITFPALKSLTTNISHNTLPSFLYGHPLIVSLSLRGPECNTCPICGVEFPNLITLQCSSQCFRTGIAHGCTIASSDRLALVHISNLSARTPLPVLRIETIALDVYPHEHDILAHIAASAPNIRKVKLNEKPPQRLQPARRAWRDLPEWHRALLRMPLVEEFCLRTFVKVGGEMRPEHAVIRGWVNGCSRRASPHPNLFRVALIQHHAENGQRLSHWFKAGRGEWECISANIVGPHHAFCI